MEDKIFIKRDELDFRRSKPLKTLSRKNYESYIFSLKDSYYPYNDNDKSKYNNYYTYQIVDENGGVIDAIQPNWEIFETMINCIRKANEELDYLQDKYDEESELQSAFIMEALKENRILNEARTLKNSNDEKMIDTLKKAVDRGQYEIKIIYQPAGGSILNKIYQDKLDNLPQGRKTKDDNNKLELDTGNVVVSKAIVDKSRREIAIEKALQRLADNKTIYSITSRKNAIGEQYVDVWDANEREHYDIFGLNSIWFGSFENFLSLFNKNESVNFLAELKK